MRKKAPSLIVSLLVALMLTMLVLPLGAAGVTTRVKDISKIQGVRDNQLMGYGIVVGLDGSGDSNKASFTIQSIASMLKNFGVNVSAGDMKLKNVAAVMVTGQLPPFAKSGDTIDVTVSSLGDAKTLQGGTLLFTPLKAANGQVYAAAQGALSIGGFSAGKQNNSVQKNHQTVARIPNGATVEQEVATTFADNGYITWSLNQSDFTTASRMANQINARFSSPLAQAVDGATVRVGIPPIYRSNPVGFISIVENVEVVPDQVAKIVINERTGTIVMGGEVKVSPIAISHGSIQVKIDQAELVSQPNPFSKGKTTTTTSTNVQVDEPKASNVILPSGANVRDLVEALNTIGATPQDIIAIVQAIKEAGALKADLEIM